MIDHRNTGAFKPAPDPLADAAHADDSNLAIAERADTQWILRRRPQAGTKIAVRLDEFAQGRDQKSERDIGDLLGQDVGRVGHNNVMFARVIGIDVVISDAERSDDFELREHGHDGAVAANRAVSDSGDTNFCRHRRIQAVEIGARFRSVEHELIGKTVVYDRFVRTVNQKIDLFRRNIPAHNLVPSFRSSWNFAKPRALENL